MNLSSAKCGDERLAGDGDFVEPSGTVHHKGALDPELCESCRHKIHDVGRKHSQDLSVRTSGIGQRTQQIENGSRANLFARRSRVARSRMRGLREQEPDSDFADRFTEPGARQINPDPELLQDIGGTAARTSCAIAMFGNSRAGSRGDNGRGSGNVERIKAVASSPASVDHMLGASFTIRENTRGVAAHGGGKGGEFLRIDRSAIQALQNTYDVRGRNAPAQEFLHK